MKGTQELGSALLSGCRHLVHHPQEYYCLSDFFGAAFNAGEDQKKLAHFTIHHQAKNNVLVHCNCKHSCKREMQRTHSSDCFLYWHLLTQSVWPLCYQLLLSPACLTLGADPNHTISQCACCPWWGQAGPVQPTCLARANISANNTWKIASSGQRAVL